MRFGRLERDSSAASAPVSGHAQRIPSISSSGIALHDALGSRHSPSSSSFSAWGMAVHAPDPSKRQAWYAHSSSPDFSTRPSERGARRCGQASSKHRQAPMTFFPLSSVSPSFQMTTSFPMIVMGLGRLGSSSSLIAMGYHCFAHWKASSPGAGASAGRGAGAEESNVAVPTASPLGLSRVRTLRRALGAEAPWSGPLKRGDFGGDCPCPLA
mmetsp:Transcript_51322/g.164079  ORF Transcript_51322/g.164079 Transcript_51322/m.164079 type:complete len:212 (+) Transcript_51322:1171-1806(+)